MSRSNYSDDFGNDYPGQINLYCANVHRAMHGRDGQARLRELRDVLLALPDKRLAADVFAPATGEACALGAWAKWKTTTDDAARVKVEGFEGDDEDTVALLQPYKWPHLVVREVVYENDRHGWSYDEFAGPHQSPYAYYATTWPVRYGRSETDEERYVRVLAWVESHLRPASSEAPR